MTRRELLDAVLAALVSQRYGTDTAPYQTAERGLRKLDGPELDAIRILLSWREREVHHD